MRLQRDMTMQLRYSSDRKQDRDGAACVSFGVRDLSAEYVLRLHVYPLDAGKRRPYWTRESSLSLLAQHLGNCMILRKMSAPWALIACSLSLTACVKTKSDSSMDGVAGASSIDSKSAQGCSDLGTLASGDRLNEDDSTSASTPRCYKLTVAQNGSLTVTLADLSETSVGLSLYAASAAPSFSAEPIRGVPSRDTRTMTLALPPDTYFLRVAGGAASYTLQVDFAEHPTSGPERDPAEKPDVDTVSLDTTDTQAVGGYVGPLDPADFYLVDVPDNGTLDVVVSDLTGGSVGFGVVVDKNEDGELSDGEQFVGKPSRDGLSIATSVPPGRYFVHVLGDGITYTLKTTFTPHVVPGPEQDPANKPKDSTVTLGQNGEGIGGYVGPLDAEDFYQVELKEQGTLTVTVADLTGGSVGFGIVQDVNGDGEYTPDKEDRGSQPSRDGLSLSRELDPGLYFVRVVGDGTTYTVKSTFTPSSGG